MIFCGQCDSRAAHHLRLYPYDAPATTRNLLRGSSLGFEKLKAEIQTKVKKAA
jgi:hypothetical protein